ncbi:DUF2182 domain-containing protein [Actinomadura sediminis]|uniref:DUF2182 domain-containing protein n=1 Tax=Actinomadura sediminis TaxID=1038904 RepID=A0ABW3ESV3_9ACTN
MRAAPHAPRAGRARGARPAVAESVFVVVLLALSAAAWAAVHRMAAPDMRMGLLTGAGRSGGMAPMPMSAGLFLGMWLVMMAAMMLPAVAPVIVRVGRMMRARGLGGSRSYALVAGYLLVWGAAGVAAYGLFQVFQATASAAGFPVVARAGAAVLLVAGVYQLTPLKGACLRQCRSPLAVVVRFGPRIAASRAGAVRAGARHGAYCLGCCWALMAVLLAAGMMSLVWMGVLSAVVLVEKTARGGVVFGRLLGAGMIVLGLVLLAAPGLSLAVA